MNVLVVAVSVLILLVLIGIIIGSAIAIITGIADALDDPPYGLLRAGAGLVVLVATITALIVLGQTFAPDDNSEHCGAGTHYVELHSGKYSGWECAAE